MHSMTWEKRLEEHVKGLEEWAIECLKKGETGCLDGEARKMTTLRIIEFSYDHPVKVKEYEV